MEVDTTSSDTTLQTPVDRIGDNTHEPFLRYLKFDERKCVAISANSVACIYDMKTFTFQYGISTFLSPLLTNEIQNWN
jgi:hypothetical protein